MRKVHRKASPLSRAIVRITEAMLEQIELFLAKRERAREQHGQILNVNVVNVQKLSAPAENRQTFPFRRMEP